MKAETIQQWESRLKNEAFEQGKHIVHEWAIEYDDGCDGCMPRGWYVIGLDANGCVIDFPVRHEYGPYASEVEAETVIENLVTVARRDTMKTTENNEMLNLPVRACSIQCKDHPEWGTFGVMEDRGDYYEIHGDGGSRVLFKSEAVKFWERVRR